MTTLPVTGNTESTAPENRAFYPALDGLRAIAFLMVFLEHYDHLPWGWAGVDLFFVLSGFLITGILYDTRDHPFRIRNFYIRRTLRIFPLYYGVMLLLLVVTPLVHWKWNWHWIVWPLYIGNFTAYVHPYVPESAAQWLADFQPHGVLHGHWLYLYLGHFWSLCVEEQFYLVWPWVVFWVRDRRKLVWICAATLPAALAARLLGQHFLPHWMLDTEVLYRATPFRLDALLIGGLIALLYRGPHRQSLLRFARFALPALVALIVVGSLFTPYRHILARPYIYPDWNFTYGLTVLDIFAALLILVCLQPGLFLSRVFSLRPLRWLGRITYGAYVLHDIPHLFYWAAGHRLSTTHSELLTSLLALTSIILLASLSFRFFESPFINLKERWTKTNPTPNP